MNDSAVAIEAGGLAELKRKRVTLPQLMRECQLALAGTPRLLAKKGYYLLYLEGRSGGLSPVVVRWNGERLDLGCRRFVQVGGWRVGDLVCGN